MVGEMRLVVLNHLTLDGVLQAPGGPEEDTRGGFRHGGWAIPGNDEVMGRRLGERSGAPGGGLLLGRRSYEQMLAHWNDVGGPFKDQLNESPKYVASSSASTELAWPNSTLLHGDVPAAIAELKEQPGGDLTIMGSGQLIRSLLVARPDRRVPADDPSRRPRVGPTSLRARGPPDQASSRRLHPHDDRRDHGDLPAGLTLLGQDVIRSGRYDSHFV